MFVWEVRKKRGEVITWILSTILSSSEDKIKAGRQTSQGTQNVPAQDHLCYICLTNERFMFNEQNLFSNKEIQALKLSHTLV